MQGELQQTPSAQNPLVHSPPAVHALPFGMRWDRLTVVSAPPPGPASRSAVPHPAASNPTSITTTVANPRLGNVSIARFLSQGGRSGAGGRTATHSVRIVTLPVTTA